MTLHSGRLLNTLCRIALSGCLLVSIAAVSASAQDGSPLPEAEAEISSTSTERPRASMVGGVWIPRLRGDAGFAAAPTGDLRYFGLDTELDLGEREPSISVDAELAVAEWRFRLGAFRFGADGEAVLTRRLDFAGFTAPTGSRLASEFDMASFALEVGYELEAFDESGVRITFTPTIAARYVEIDHEMRTGSPVRRTAVSPEEIGLLGGARIGINVKDTIVVRAGGAFGGNLGGGHIAQLDVDVTWIVKPNIGVTFGYRLLDTIVEDDEYEFDGQLAGLYLGGTIRF